MRIAIRRAAFVAALASCAAPIGAQEYQPRMGEPIRGLTPAQLDRFTQGGVAFNQSLSIAEGLGPIFNDDSCGVCHSTPQPGGFSTTSVTRFGQSGPPFDPLVVEGGSLLQDTAISPGCQEIVPASADVITLRMTPHVFGAGLVEAIPDADLIAYVTNPPPSLPQAGVAHMVQPLEGGPQRVGRFGWKSQVATLLTFSADAALNEMGLTNRLLMVEEAPNGDQVALAACDSVPDPEDGPDLQGFDKIDRFTDFQRFLAPPPQTPRSGMTGESVFTSVGCADCHVPSFTTGVAAEAALTGVELRAYSDFLLHDMGSLGDGIVQGAGTETRMRTAPLWGMSQRQTFLHDGSAAGGTFEQIVDIAILAHEGDAAPARDAYAALGSVQRDQLLAFLGSLGRAEFDEDDDNNVDVFDFFFMGFNGAFTGPAPVSAVTPDDPDAYLDVDQDGDVDLADMQVFQRAFTGQVF